jgi:2-haloacid dehalogenase
MPSASLILFDVNETLSDLEPLRARFMQVGAPGHLLEVWFAGTLRDGFALTAAGAHADFKTVAIGVLSGLLGPIDTRQDGTHEAAEEIVAGLAELDLHPDVAGAMRKLAAAGIRMATLTNGSAQVATTLLERAGLADIVERCVSADEVQRWKPAPEPYLHAVSTLDTQPGDSMLIAVHPWDIDGAKRAGLQAGWLNRKHSPYPRFFATSDVDGDSLDVLADAVLLRA